MAEINLSNNVAPPQTFDNEPILIIYDPTQYIADRGIDLNPFNNILTLITDENLLIDEIRNSNKALTIIFILPQSTQAQVLSFIQGDPGLSTNINRYRLFFIDGQNLFADSHSITSQILPLTRELCAQTNTENIAYCEQERLSNEQRGEFGVANSYAMQSLVRTEINLHYNDRIRFENFIRRLR